MYVSDRSGTLARISSSDGELRQIHRTDFHPLQSHSGDMSHSPVNSLGSSYSETEPLLHHVDGRADEGTETENGWCSVITIVILTDA